MTGHQRWRHSATLARRSLLVVFIAYAQFSDFASKCRAGNSEESRGLALIVTDRDKHFLDVIFDCFAEGEVVWR